MIKYKQLCEASKQAADMPKQIKKTAHKICERRRRDGTRYRNIANAVKAQRTSYEALINELESSLTVCTNAESVGEIQTVINLLRGKLEAYEETVSELATRFENAVIRVLSFGFKTQGKSLFTKMYTHITDDRIVSVKSNTDEDQTGATNIIKHKKDVNPSASDITVFFRKQEDILDLVNNAILEVSKVAQPACLPNNFSSYSEFEQFISNPTKKENAYNAVKGMTDSDKKSLSFDSAKSLLLSIFNKVSDFSMVSHSEIKISADEMPCYNSMQAPDKQRYLSVDYILIEVDLGYGDMFENIEICDTKGLSEDAGGDLIEDELVRIINNADAVFSIQKIMQDGGMKDKFVTKLKTLSQPQRVNCHIKYLKDRHFCIANVVNNITPVNVANFEEKLNQNGLVHELYVGSLIDGPYDGESIKAQKFVDTLILDMIGQIVSTTRSLDKKLVNDCSDLARDVNILVDQLKSKLKKLKIEAGGSYEHYLLKNVENLRRRIMGLLLKESDDLKVKIDNVDSVLGSAAIADSEFHGVSDEEDYDDDYEDDDGNDNLILGNSGSSNYSDLDTSMYHSSPNDYAQIKSRNKSIYYALTHNLFNDKEWLKAKTWDVREEIIAAVDYLLDRSLILKDDQYHVDSEIAEWNGTTPPADVYYIGCNLDMLRDKFMSLADDNLMEFRAENGSDKKDQISHIYEIIFEELKLYEIYPDKIVRGFDGIINCTIDNSVIESLCNVARSLNLGDKDSSSWLPSSYKFIKKYFAYAKDVSSTAIGVSILEREAAKAAIVDLLMDCRNAIAAEIEMKDADAQSPISVCLRQVINILKDVSKSKLLCDLYIGAYDNEHLDKLEKWGLISADNRKEYDRGIKRDRFNEIRKKWYEMLPISSVY